MGNYSLNTPLGYNTANVNFRNQKRYKTPKMIIPKISEEEQAHIEALKQKLDWDNLSNEEKISNARSYINGKEQNLHNVCVPIQGSNGTKKHIRSIGDAQYEQYLRLQGRADRDIDSIAGLDDDFRKQLNSLVIDVGIKYLENRKTFQGRSFSLTEDIVEKNKAYADFALFGYSSPDKLVKRFKMSRATKENPELAAKTKMYNPKLGNDSVTNIEAKQAKNDLYAKMKEIPNPTQDELDEYCRSKFHNFQQLMDKDKPAENLILDNQNSSGLYAQAFVKYKNPNDKSQGIEEVVVAVRGSDNAPDIKDDYKMFIQGEKGTQLNELSNFYEKIRKQVGKDTPITFAGHSLGGGLSTLMAYKYRGKNVKAYGQCAPDVFDVIYKNQKDFGYNVPIENIKVFSKILATSGANITLFNNSGDILTHDGVYAGAKVYLYDHIKEGISHHQVLDSKKLSSAVQPSAYDKY